MDIEAIRSKLAANGLGHYFTRLQPVIRNSIRLYQEESNEDDISVGQTKIGGRPDLPASISWMMETNIERTITRKFFIFTGKHEKTVSKPLSFIAQVNLAETATFDEEGLLPKSGLLYFFYAAEQDAWGFDPRHNNKFKVIYWDGDLSQLSRTEFPHDLPDHARFKASAVTMKSEASLPSYDDEAYEMFSSEDADNFWDNVNDDEVNINKMLGYADVIQNDMELDCELVTNGINSGDGTSYKNPRRKQLEPNAKNWRLLLQVDSNDENEMMWGDCGRLYFWIKKEDLLQKKFDRCWFHLQCT